MTEHRTAIRCLRKADDQMARVIDKVGPCRLSPTGGRFYVLANSIVSQQISTAAARTISKRLRKLCGGRISATGLHQLSDDALQGIGLSRQKRAYLQDLTDRSLDGRLNFRRLPHLDDEAVISELTAIKGIGRWTAQMFLLFGLGRPDIFAPGDLGLQNAIQILYTKPGKQQQKLSEARLLSIAEQWAPWRSVASWYLWRSLDHDFSSDA